MGGGRAFQSRAPFRAIEKDIPVGGRFRPFPLSFRKRSALLTTRAGDSLLASARFCLAVSGRGRRLTVDARLNRRRDGQNFPLVASCGFESRDIRLLGVGRILVTWGFACFASGGRGGACNEREVLSIAGRFRPQTAGQGGSLSSLKGARPASGAERILRGAMQDVRPRNAGNMQKDPTAGQAVGSFVSSGEP